MHNLISTTAIRDILAIMLLMVVVVLIYRDKIKNAKKKKDNEDSGWV